MFERVFNTACFENPEDMIYELVEAEVFRTLVINFKILKKF